jgi:hypothetical protein
VLQAKYKEKLISCRSKATEAAAKVHTLVLKSRRLQQSIGTLKKKGTTKSVATAIDKDARKAASHAAGRVAKLKMQLRLSQKSGGKRAVQLAGELGVAQKELKVAQFKAATAAQAGRGGAKRLHNKLGAREKKLNSVLARLKQHRAKEQAAQKCVQAQLSLIAQAQKKFLVSQLHSKTSKKGNMFDQRHNRAAAQLHHIEKVAYQARLHEDSLRKKQKQYKGALAELMMKLNQVTDAMDQKTVQKLVLDMKNKARSEQGALAIAVQKRKQAELERLKAASKVATMLEKKNLQMPSVKAKQGPAFTMKQKTAPSAVHSAVASILSQP